MAAGHHGGGRPLAAARGCRLLRRFFFLLKTRKVILAGPRQGQASLRSVRTRTLDMACSARIGEAQEGGRKRKNAAATGRFAARGRTACFTPRHHGRNWALQEGTCDNMQQAISLFSSKCYRLAMPNVGLT